MAELVSSLSDRSLSVSEKLKVACYLWRHGELLVVEKNAFLLQWACQELTRAYNKKSKSPAPLDVTASKLWCFLAGLLQAMEEQQCVEDSSLSLNKHLFQVSCENSCLTLLTCVYTCTGYGRGLLLSSCLY